MGEDNNAKHGYGSDRRTQLKKYLTYMQVECRSLYAVTTITTQSPITYANTSTYAKLHTVQQTRQRMVLAGDNSSHTQIRSVLYKSPVLSIEDDPELISTHLSSKYEVTKTTDNKPYLQLRGKLYVLCLQYVDQALVNQIQEALTQLQLLLAQQTSQYSVGLCCMFTKEDRTWSFGKYKLLLTALDCVTLPNHGFFVLDIHDGGESSQSFWNQHYPSQCHVFATTLKVGTQSMASCDEKCVTNMDMCISPLRSASSVMNCIQFMMAQTDNMGTHLVCTCVAVVMTIISG